MELLKCDECETNYRGPDKKHNLCEECEKTWPKAQSEPVAEVPCSARLCGIDQAGKDYNDDMDRLEAKMDHGAKPISERERERLINKSCGD